MGNVGSIAALLLHKMGAVVVGVSDVSGGLYNDHGLPIEEIVNHTSQRKLLSDYEITDAERITNQQLLTCECDVLIPAALQNQITAEIANNLKAKYIVEGANGPVTAEADEILEKKGVIVVPDILANAGGVVVSYFEWVQNIQSLMWEEGHVNEMLKNIMTNAFNEVWDLAAEKDTSLRLGAYMLALKRIVAAKNLRGIFP